MTTAKDIRRFIHPESLALRDPFLLPGMAKAVALIRPFLDSKQPILVYGDYDVDGVTAASILAPTLKSLGGEVFVHLPHRIKEGYGLNRQTLKAWIKKGIRLVITVDNGITSFDAVRDLKEAGIQVVIVDHHLPKKDFPPADVIVSGVLPGAVEEDGDLAACGLAFKLCWALHGDFDKAKPLLDLVTLGTVADLAPVVGENRILLKMGLPILSKTLRPGLLAMMAAAKIHPSFITYRDLAFGLGPRINAAGRMGTPFDAYKLLTTENAVEARNLAQVLEVGNKQRQQVEEEAFRKAVRSIEADSTWQDQTVLVVAEEGWHEGVIGIMASRLVERFGRPCIVIALNGETGKGSGRSTPSFSIFDRVSPHESILEAFGGHSQACGLSIRRDRVDAFRNALNLKHAEDSASPGGEPEDFLWLDGEMNPADLTVDLIKDLAKLEPHGPGNPQPRFLTHSMRVKGGVQKRGKDTLSCWLSDEKGKLTCEAVAFRSYEKWQKEMADKTWVDIAYRPGLRNTNGISTIQLELVSWRQTQKPQVSNFASEPF
jgi:single-stranded-DNA-specific exonuclease